MAGHLLLGALPAAALWVVLRRGVGAGLTGPLAWLDALPVALGFALGLLATGRPVLTAVLLVAAGAGLLVVDRVKRAVLREPLVFADRAELLELVRHPELYLPFAGTGRVVAGAAAAAAALGGLAWAEPPLWPVRLWHPPLAVALGAACFLVPA